MAIEKEYTLKLTTKQAQENVDELNKSLEAQADLIDDIEKEIRDYEKQLNKTSQKDLAGRKNLNDKIKVTKERLKDEKVALKDVNKEKKKANETLKKSIANQKDYSGVLGIIDGQTGGAITKFKSLTTTIGGATKGFKLLKIAIIGTGIGALVVAIASLGAAFTASEEGQNKFTKLMGQIGVVTGNVIDILANLGEGLFAIGTALVKLATGDIAGASAAWGEFKENINEVTEGIKNFGEETKKEIAIMNQLNDARANADKLERGLIVERAKANRDRAELLEKAVNKEKFNLSERIGFLKEAGAIEEEITNKEIESARVRLETKILENSLSKSTKEDLDEQAQLQARLIELETAKLTKAKEVTSQIIALNAEARAAELAAQAETERIEAEKKAEKDAIDSEEKAAKIESDKIAEDERLKKLKESADEEIRIAKIVVDQKKQLQTANLNNIASGFALLGQLAGKNKALQAAAIIGESAVGIARTIIQTQTSNVATTAQGAALAIPTGGTSVAAATALVTANNIGAGIGIAANVASTAKALSSLGKGGAPSPQQVRPQPSTNVPNLNESQPPAFNIVGQSETNQLADAIGGQTQQPVQAFVVSSEVTTAQELDRNIIDGASIG